MKRYVKILCILVCVFISITGCTRYKWQENTIFELTSAFDTCKNSDQQCFEAMLGPGLTGVTEDGDIYEKWEGSERKVVANSAQIGGGGD